MTAIYDRIAVLGLGLLGGSVARAARERGAARTVVGATRRRSSLERALAEGVIDVAAPPVAAVRDAELVVLATPVSAMAETLREAAAGLSAGAVVTDVGSVKTVLHETLPGLLPPGVRYIGSHPMAGSHERGFEQSRSDLFDGAPCVVTEIENSPDQARLCAFWRALGCDVIVRGPAEHDVEAAWVSHVPHALAYGFAAALANAPLAARDVAGSGFRDFTRIARSDPEMWSEILTQNRKALAAPLQAVGEALAEIGRAIAADDADVVERRINAAREVLARYTNERTNGNAPPGDGHPVSKQR